MGKTGTCEVCGKTAGLVIIHKQIKGEYVRLNVCRECSEEHEKELERTRQNFYMQFCSDEKPETKPVQTERRKIIAVDFDGTLCENKWPGIGEPNQEIIDYLIDQRKQGAQIILWSCRTGEQLLEASRWCSEQGLYLDAINENLPQPIAHFGEDTRKIYADEYIDDKACTKFQLPFKANN